MIFATCGSTPVRFDRMMEALRVLPTEELCVQHGASPAPPCARSFDFLPFGTMVELIGEADVVVSHAGVGSIMCALQAGHVPIVFPRLREHAEAVDDHQSELAEALALRGTVRMARNAEELARAVASVPPRGAVQALDATQLVSAVRAAIMVDEAPRSAPWSRSH